MRNEHQYLFSGSPFVRWTVTLLTLLLASVMPVAFELGTTKATVTLVSAIEVLCLLLLVAFWAPPLVAHLAFRCICGLVLIAYAAYLIAELMSGEPFTLSGRRSDTSPRNALIGFFVIGIPAFSYAVFGRFTLRAPDARPSDLDTDDDDQKNNVA